MKTQVYLGWDEWANTTKKCYYNKQTSFLENNNKIQ